MKPNDVIESSGIQQAYLLQRYVAERYEVHISVGEAWMLLENLPSESYGFDVALSGRLNEGGHFDSYGQCARDIEKLDPLRITVTLNMPWSGEPFDDATSVTPKVARSKLFKSMTPIKPVNALAAIVGGEL